MNIPFFSVAHYICHSFQCHHCDYRIYFKLDALEATFGLDKTQNKNLVNNQWSNLKMKTITVLTSSEGMINHTNPA